MSVALEVLAGFIGFAKKLGEPLRFEKVDIVPFWPILAIFVLLLWMVSLLQPRTVHGIRMVVGWTCVLALPVIVTLLIAAFLMITGYPVGPPK